MKKVINCKNSAITNEDLYYYVGCNIIQHRIKRAPAFGGRYIKFKPKLEDREFIIEWAKKKLYPFLPPEKEIIPRDQWDLDGLVGATEKQLFHPHFDIMRRHLYQCFRPKHSVAMFMLCSNKKPYFTNFLIKKYWKLIREKADLFVVSNPGIIPIEYSNYYPFRYYEWDETEETPEIKQLYTKAVYDRAQDWLLHFPTYKAFFSLIRPGETLDALMAITHPFKGYHILYPGWEEEWSQVYPQFITYHKGRRSFSLLKNRVLNLSYTQQKVLNYLQSFPSKFEFGGFV